LVLLVFILLWAFFGTIQASKNAATLFVWSLWWALLPFSFLLFGRVWCSVCPLGKAGDLVQGWFKMRRRDPGTFLKRYGMWIMIALFVMLTWFDRISSFAGSPRSTGILLLILLAGAVITMFFFRRRTWCRYLCPIGGLSGIYSMVVPISLSHWRPERDLFDGLFYGIEDRKRDMS
jgi:polyferredoxin